MSNISELIKRAALDAVDSKVPCDIVFGEVVKIKPVEIRIDSNLILKEAYGQLKFARNVTDYDVKLKTDLVEQTYTVKNALKVGETVIMFKKHGGQSYLVYDRLAVKS